MKSIDWQMLYLATDIYDLATDIYDLAINFINTAVVNVLNYELQNGSWIIIQKICKTSDI